MKLALKTIDDKRLYLNPLRRLPFDTHHQQQKCGCKLLCILQDFVSTIFEDKYPIKIMEALKNYKQILNQQQITQMKKWKAFFIISLLDL